MNGASAGPQFFGQVDIDGASEVMSVRLEDPNGTTFFAKEPIPEVRPFPAPPLGRARYHARTQTEGSRVRPVGGSPLVDTPRENALTISRSTRRSK